MQYVQHIVTGAPGAGKSTALEAFLKLRSQFVAFDIDWLGITASDLARRDIFLDQSTWPAYGALWFEVLYSIHRNNRTPVFFAPTDPGDIERSGKPQWCSALRWLRLDCDDALRQHRLRQREGWTEAMIDEAMEDAWVLRQLVPNSLDTGAQSPDTIAGGILDWLGRTVN